MRKTHDVMYTTTVKSLYCENPMTDQECPLWEGFVFLLYNKCYYIVNRFDSIM